MAGILRRGALGCALSLAFAITASAQENDPLRALHQYTGTLKKIQESGVIRIGHRVNSIPFAFLNQKGQAVGYSLDLCDEIVEDIISELGKEVRVEYRPVTPENRFDMVASGEVDLECGSTTNTLERRKRVAFSPTIFVTGTKLLVRKESGVRFLRDLKGKTIVFTRGTVQEPAMQALNERQKLGITFVTGGDHKESFQILESGKADAWANDDILLYGMLAETRTGDKFRVVGDFLTFDPFALMFRKDDPEFEELVNKSFGNLAGSRAIVHLYNKWFMKRLPNGVRLNLPMSPHLEELFRVQGMPGD